MTPATEAGVDCQLAELVNSWGLTSGDSVYSDVQRSLGNEENPGLTSRDHWFHNAMFLESMRESSRWEGGKEADTPG